MNRAIFLDKDGTIVDNVPYNVRPQLIRLADGAAAGLRSLQAAGFKLILVTNQSGLAKGLFTSSELQIALDRTQELLSTEGIELAGYYICPHHPEGRLPELTLTCTCRKPQPGLLLHAAAQHNINLAASWMIGDILDDIEAGHRAGCHAALVDQGNETEWRLGPLRQPDLRLTSLTAIAAAITTRPSLSSVGGTP